MYNDQRGRVRVVDSHVKAHYSGSTGFAAHVVDRKEIWATNIPHNRCPSEQGRSCVSLRITPTFVANGHNVGSLNARSCTQAVRFVHALHT